MSTQFIDTTSHDFKNHFSEYVRLLQENPETVITVFKYKTPIGFFIPYDSAYEARKAQEEQRKEKIQPKSKATLEESFDINGLVENMLKNLGQH